jgi:hypothetical protein
MNKINLNYNLPDIDGVGFGEVNVRSIADGRADGRADGKAHCEIADAWIMTGIEAMD